MNIVMEIRMDNNKPTIETANKEVLQKPTTKEPIEESRSRIHWCQFICSQRLELDF